MRVFRRWPAILNHRQYSWFRVAYWIFSTGWLALLAWAWLHWDELGWSSRLPVAALLAVTIPSVEDLFQSHQTYLREVRAQGDPLQPKQREDNVRE